MDAAVSFTKASPSRQGGPGAKHFQFPRTVSLPAPSAEPSPLSARSVWRQRPTEDVTAGYARVCSGEELNGSAVFQTISGDTVTSEAGVGLSPPSDHFTVYIDNVNNALSGYAVANPIPDCVTSPAIIAQKAWGQLTMTLRNKSGVTLETKTLNLAPDEHVAEFASQRFPATAAAGFEGSIEFSSGTSRHQFQAGA